MLNSVSAAVSPKIEETIPCKSSLVWKKSLFSCMTEQEEKYICNTSPKTADVLNPEEVVLYTHIPGLWLLNVTDQFRNYIVEKGSDQKQDLYFSLSMLGNDRQFTRNWFIKTLQWREN